MNVPNERKLTIARSMAEAVAQEMRVDPSVFVMGEDIAALGGVYGNTRGLLEEFGKERIRDTPISETAFIGAAVTCLLCHWRVRSEVTVDVQVSFRTDSSSKRIGLRASFTPSGLIRLVALSPLRGGVVQTILGGEYDLDRNRLVLNPQSSAP
ncbi:hypothetical protein [Ruegeria atlantica]|uniref:2-oxoisovalerate dehydrogenase subunit beta n=1 Tax=Ruegeria atlantica TaxID=81569 RepID=A0A0P1E8Z0_9RHOB|nr:hypothetical protein [Ruegeria atlantica]CUH45594.1 2-oxoisovalerate dehydrogenase subunit beta [Ruegeria atlantica]